MSRTLAERRELLRSALVADDPNDITGFVAALDGASEDERAHLAKTLPASRLFRAEGWTPRACFVVTALAKPKAASDTLTPQTMADRERLTPRAASLAPVVVQAALGRDPAWQAAFVGAFCEWSWWGIDLIWPVSHTLVSRHGVPPTLGYLTDFLSEVMRARTQGLPTAERGEVIAERIRGDETLLADFWSLFTVEGIGSQHFVGDQFAPAWDDALARLSGEVAGFRERLLEESLAALLRDFAARTIPWYLRVHRHAQPTADEIEARQGSYLAVLATAPSTAVGLAQEQLGKILDSPNLDLDGLIEASGAVLVRTEKKLLKAQLGLLAKLPTNPAQRQRIGDLMAEALPNLPLDLASVAAKLTVAEPGPATEDEPAGEPVSVPPPHTTALPARSARPPISDDAEFIEVAGALLEGVGDGADITRLLSFAGRRPPRAAAALADRARAIFDDVWDLDTASPRRHLAAWLLQDARRLPRYIGFTELATFRVDAEVPTGYETTEHSYTHSTVDGSGREQVVESGRFLSGQRGIANDTPAGLLVHQFALAKAGHRLSTPLLPVPRVWRRLVVTPGKGRWGQAPDGLVPVWEASDPTGLSELDARALAVTRITAEYSYRLQSARDQDGYDQIVAWAAWLLADNLDTLAAHEHPALLAATRFKNVRGVSPLMVALGEGRQPPGPPVYSALALGLSAFTAEHRAQAAEAVAAVAGVGLLDPAGLAEQVRLHLADGFVQAGRLATALTDAAGISAIAGYRVLQTLAGLLPALAGVNQAARLVELAARLGAEYGTPVPVPESLAAKRKGSSVLAKALRALDAVTPRPTTVAADAATQANVEQEDER